MPGGSECKMKRLTSYAGPLVMVLFVMFGGGWHFLQTRAGALGTGDVWLGDLYLVTAFAAAVFLAFLAFALFIRKIRPELGAGLTVLVLGILYMTALPPLSAPDEISHFVSAYAVSNCILGEAPVDEEGNVKMRAEDEFLQNIYGVSGDEARESLGRVLTEETWKQIASRGTPVFVSPEQNVMVSSVQKPVGTTPAAYLAPALGITIGRLLGVNCVILAFLGRLFNLLFFAAMIYGSVRILPFGKTVLWGAALLPMTLHLAASCSYDAFLTGMCFFYGSYALHLAYAKPAVQKRDIAVLAVLAAAFGPCKMVYAVVLGMALLIPTEKFGGWRGRILSAGAVLLAFGLAMLAVNRGTIAAYASGSDTYVAWAGEEGFSLPLILHNPLLYFRMLYESLANLGDEWTMQMFGSMLGNLDPVLSVPFFVTLAMAVCLAVLSTRKAGEALYLGGGQKAWICVLALGCLLGLMTAMLVAWTPVSSSVIEGVQGRYLLPVLPFVLMTLKSGRLVRTAGSDERLIFYLCALDCYTVFRLFSIVSMRL